MTATPAIDGWFTTGPTPALVATRCTACRTLFFPPVDGACRNPACGGGDVERVELSRHGTVWSTPTPATSPLRRTSRLPRGTRPSPWQPSSSPRGSSSSARSQGYGVDALTVGTEVELVVEPLYTDDTGERTIWRWKPLTELGEEDAR